MEVGGGGLCSVAQFCMGCNTKYHIVSRGRWGGGGGREEKSIKYFLNNS